MANKTLSPHEGTTTKHPSTFANMNVREFFETQSVEVTKETKKRVKQEIERKREELRVLVGERYRDLIDAADTIGTMRTGSAEVFTKLTTLRSSIIALPTLLKCSGIGDFENENRNLSNVKKINLNEKELEIAAELKLSKTVPRQFLVCLEENDIVGALHLSLLYKMELDPSRKPYKWPLLNGNISFPDASSVNNDLSEQMVESLLNYCDHVLEEFTSSSARLADCIIVKQILKSCSCEEVLNGFLKKRVELCEKALESSTGEEFVTKVASSVLSLNQIFLDPELYNAAAKKVRKAKITPDTLGFISSYMPVSLNKFNSETIQVQEPPRVSVLAETILKYYIEPLKTVLMGTKVKNFMDHPTTLREMEEIRLISCKILKRDTEDLMRIVLGSSTNIWEEVFSAAFTLKCQLVITAKIQQLLSTLKENTKQFHDVGVNFELVNFIWKTGTITEFLGTDLFLEESLKLRCLSPSVVQLCLALEDDLHKLLGDFQSLVDNPLKEFISSEISAGLEKFINEPYSREECWNLFLGRFTGAVPELCPTLWKLMEKNDGMKVKKLLGSQSEKRWGDWTATLQKDFAANLDKRMAEFSPNVVATFMPVGEVYKAEGEDVQPSVRVPLQLSHALHTLLSTVCLSLSQVGPQSIPKIVRENLRFNVGESVISHYEKLIGKLDGDNLTESISPQMAIQFIFDLKFIQWFDPKLGGNVESLYTKLQSVIDPFDWDICNPRLTLNLKRFLFENHLTLGLLFSEECHDFIAQNFKTKQNQSFPFSNAMLSIPLPLLPI